MTNNQIKENYTAAYQKLDELAYDIVDKSAKVTRPQIYDAIKKFQKASDDLIYLLAMSNNWHAKQMTSGKTQTITNCPQLHQCSLAQSNRVRTYRLFTSKVQ